MIITLGTRVELLKNPAAADTGLHVGSLGTVKMIRLDDDDVYWVEFDGWPYGRVPFFRSEFDPPISAIKVVA